MYRLRIMAAANRLQADCKMYVSSCWLQCVCQLFRLCGEKALSPYSHGHGLQFGPKSGLNRSIAMIAMDNLISSLNSSHGHDGKCSAFCDIG